MPIQGALLCQVCLESTSQTITKSKLNIFMFFYKLVSSVSSPKITISLLKKSKSQPVRLFCCFAKLLENVKVLHTLTWTFTFLVGIFAMFSEPIIFLHYRVGQFHIQNFSRGGTSQNIHPVGEYIARIKFFRVTALMPKKCHKTDRIPITLFDVQTLDLITSKQAFCFLGIFVYLFSSLEQIHPACDDQSLSGTRGQMAP